MKHIYLFSPIPYTFLHQRPQQLADNFAARGIPVTYVEPCGFTEYLAGRKKGVAKLVFISLFYHSLGLLAFLFRSLGRKPQPKAESTSARGKIEFISLPLVIPQTRFNSCLLERINASVYRQVLIRQVFRKMPKEEISIAVVQNPYYATVIQEGDFSGLFYDCLDEISLFAGRASIDRFEKYETKAISLANAVSVTASKLEDHIRSLNPDASVHRIPNGVDAEWFQENGSRESELLRKIRKPIAGYTGTLSSWLDYGLIGELAETFPEVSFVFVGPLDLDSRIEGLRKYPNIHWLGRKEYSEMPSLISAFTVCLIPFLIGDISRTTNPVKLYEYFSLGKPVVTTQLSELETYRESELLYMANDRAEFVEYLRRALEENNHARQQLRKDVAMRHSWQSHAATMVSLFDQPTNASGAL